MKTNNITKSMLELSLLAKKTAFSVADDIEKAVVLISESLKRGGKIMVCGNGGSAADSQHFAAELIGRLEKDRKSLPAISLTCNTSSITAIGNDYGFEYIFSRQIAGLANKNDVLILISTSGQSSNIIEAAKSAQKKGIASIALLGARQNQILEKCTLCIHIPSINTQRIQELHTAVLHVLCETVEKRLKLNL